MILFTRYCMYIANMCSWSSVLVYSYTSNGPTERLDNVRNKWIELRVFFEGPSCRTSGRRCDAPQDLVSWVRSVRLVKVIRHIHMITSHITVMTSHIHIPGTLLQVTRHNHGEIYVRHGSADKLAQHLTCASDSANWHTLCALQICVLYCIIAL